MGAGVTRENLRHAIAMLRYGANPAATVYDSIGPDFFLALAPGWLNLGLWEGDGGDAEEAPVAVRRLVERLAADLPVGGDVLDVANGLAAQDPVIAEVAHSRSLTAVNITWSQLEAGRGRLRDAGARAVCADACRLPVADASFDGLISVEAAFHFSSRERFLREAFRVLRPGGVLTMSDVPTLRRPGGVREAVAAVAYGSREPDAGNGLLVCDTGGTTFDVSLVSDGKIHYTDETWLGRGGKIHSGFRTGRLVRSGLPRLDDEVGEEPRSDQAQHAVRDR